MSAIDASASAPAISWRDPKRYLWPLGLIVPTLPLLAWLLVELSGLGIFWWTGPVVVFGIFPIADWIVGKDSANPPESIIKHLEEDRFYRWCTYLFLPLQFGSLVIACALWSGGTLSTLESVGLMFTVAMVGGIAINTAHELGHKRKQAERWLSKVALAQTGYGHFYIEHNRGHHVRVATPEDPASSRLGESFWEFLPRSVAGSLTSAWELEKERLSRSGSRSLTIRNDILNAWAMTVVLFAALVAVFGLVVLPYLLAQAVIGFSLLEVVNYLEHYGLLRSEARGRPLRALPARALVELQQRQLQRAALPPAAPLRPPCEPRPALPGPASLRRGARAALRLRDDDRARLCLPAVAPRDGSQGARALRRRRDAREHPPAQARADPGALRSRLGGALRLPRLRLRL